MLTDTKNEKTLLVIGIHNGGHNKGREKIGSKIKQPVNFAYKMSRVLALLEDKNNGGHLKVLSRKQSQPKPQEQRQQSHTEALQGNSGQTNEKLQGNFRQTNIRTLI